MFLFREERWRPERPKSSPAASPINRRSTIPRNRDPRQRLENGLTLAIRLAFAAATPSQNLNPSMPFLTGAVPPSTSAAEGPGITVTRIPLGTRPQLIDLFAPSGDQRKNLVIIPDTGQTPMAQPPAVQTPMAQPPAVQPPMAQPPAVQPPMAQPPVVQPPMAAPTATESATAATAQIPAAAEQPVPSTDWALTQQQQQQQQALKQEMQTPSSGFLQPWILVVIPAGAILAVIGGFWIASIQRKRAEARQTTMLGKSQTQWGGQQKPQPLPLPGPIVGMGPQPQQQSCVVVGHCTLAGTAPYTETRYI